VVAGSVWTPVTIDADRANWPMAAIVAQSFLLPTTCCRREGNGICSYVVLANRAYG
jgi:hypothetical protein